MASLRYNEDPERFGVLLEGLSGRSISSAIEQSEARGQRDLVRSMSLPKDIRGGREAFEAMGIVFGADVDDLFVDVTLPEGWTKRATDHSMWSELVDDKGRKRASIFYKAAFYDRSAHMGPVTRFSYNAYADAPEGKLLCLITDGGKPIHEILVDATEPRYAARDQLGDHAEAWLNERYPNWHNASAYWDEP